jgi:hypothetical protein
MNAACGGSHLSEVAAVQQKQSKRRSYFSSAGPTQLSEELGLHGGGGGGGGGVEDEGGRCGPHVVAVGWKG